MNNTCYSLVLAGGSGKRLNPTQKKQFLKINNIPLFIYSLQVFVQSNAFDEVILVYSAEDKHLYQNELKQHNMLEKITLVEGGNTRVDSVFNGLNYLKDISDANDYVLIHDAARPIIDLTDIQRVIDELQHYDAVTPGYPMSDTIKLFDENQLLIENVPRKNVWGIQTPQGFKFTSIYQSHINIRSLRSFESLTDDTEICHRSGVTVKIIEGSKKNFKITYPEDLKLAELFLTS